MPSVEPLIRAAALQGFDPVVRELGGDPGALLRRHGLPARATDRPESMISLPRLARTMETAARDLDCPDFGLRVGGRQDPTMLGMLAVVLQGAGTVGGALVDATRYLSAHSPAYRLVLEDPDPVQADAVAVHFEVDLAPGVPIRQLIDGCVASLLTMARHLTGQAVGPVAVSLPHTPVAPRSRYRALLAGPVEFEQTAAVVHVPKRLLETDIRGARPDLRRLAIAHLARFHPPRSDRVSDRVRAALQATLGANRGTRVEIADLLDLHPRTLQRRLDAEGTTFDALRLDVYRTATWRLLADTSIPFAQAAPAVGFSEQSAMNRSVRRWFGLTPTQIRGGALPFPR
jgi:AraC-like DNA-binding protein